MKKRGFTLIELLAVIVIIGILSLIAVPIVTKQIDETRKKTYSASVRGLIDSVKNYMASNDIGDYLLASGISIPNDEIYKNLDIKNQSFISGRIYLDKNQVLQVENVSDGTFCATGTKTELEIIKGSCDILDVTAPVIDVNVSRTTSNSITIVVNSEDDESGITTYKYYLNGSLIEQNNNNVYTFKNLTANTTYTIMVKTINGNGMEATKSLNATTLSDKFVWEEKPEEWSHNKTITLSYPNLSGIETYDYKVVGTTDWIPVTGNRVDIAIDKVSTITARLLKEGTVIYTETKTFAKIDNEPPVINEITGNDDTWTTSKRITINAVDIKSGLADKAYSFDGGVTWQESPSKTFTTNGTVQIIVKDKLDNATEIHSVELTKIDPTIPKVHTITATAGNENYTSDTWTNKDVVLKANPTPIATLSGYKYQWYMKSGDKYVELAGETRQTLTVPFNGTDTFHVKISTGAGAGPIPSTNEYVVKIDKIDPTCEWSGENSTWTTETQKILSKCVDEVGGSGCSISRQWTFDDTVQTANLSYTIFDEANNIAQCAKTVDVYIDKTKPIINVIRTIASTKNIGINYTMTDAHSGIDGSSISCKLGKTQGNYDIDGIIKGNFCINANSGVGTNLEDNTTYYYQITASDKVGNQADVAEGSVTTVPLPNITFDVTDETIWTKTKDVTINAEKVGGTTLQYQVVDYAGYLDGTSKLSSTAWVDIEPGRTIPSITAKSIVYARVTDGYNISDNVSKTITKIDNTGPIITTALRNSTTKSISITYVVSDSESGVNSNQCCYRISGTGSNGKTCVNPTSTTCTMSGLKDNTKYDYLITASDKAGNVTEVENSITTKEFSPCTVTNTTGSGWAQSKNVKIEGVTAGATLQYRIGVTGAWTAITSGSSINITSNTTVYCRLWDDVNASSTASTTITGIDRTAPQISNLTNSSGGNWTNQNITVTYDITEKDSGINYCQYKYAYDQYGNCNNSWCNYNPTVTNNKVNDNYSAERNTTVYMRCVDNAGNISNELSTPIKIDKTAPTISFDYSNVTSLCTANGDSYSCSGSTPAVYLSCTDGSSGVNAFFGQDEQWTCDIKSNTTGEKITIKVCSPMLNGQTYRRVIGSCADKAGNQTTTYSKKILRTRSGSYDCRNASGCGAKYKAPTTSGGSGTTSSSADLDSGTWRRTYFYSKIDRSTTVKTCYTLANTLQFDESCVPAMYTQCYGFDPSSATKSCYYCARATRTDNVNCTSLCNTYSTSRVVCKDGIPDAG